MCPFNNIQTFFYIVKAHINTAGGRSYSTASKVVSQSQIVPSYPNAATLLGVVICWEPLAKHPRQARDTGASSPTHVSTVYRLYSMHSLISREGSKLIIYMDDLHHK